MKVFILALASVVFSAVPLYRTPWSGGLQYFRRRRVANKRPLRDIQYRRVTSRFFELSSYKGDRVWYNRCNFGNSMIHCVLINYPASEERLWGLLLSGK